MKEAWLTKVNFISLDKDYNSYKTQTKINKNIKNERSLPIKSESYFIR